jgi:hypothetical protein
MSYKDSIRQNKFIKFGSIIRGQIYVDKSPSIENTILLCGSGRSGTTWIAEILNNDNQFRYMFEPFHPKLVPIVSHFNSRQYLRASNKNKKYIFPATRILSGRIRNLWIDRYNKNMFPKKKLIKDIRINLLLRWIKTNFPGIRLIFMLRHPFAVASARIRLGWKDHLYTFFEQKDLVEDFPFEFFDERYGNVGVFEKQIIMWCIENYVPITSLREDEIYILFYENLYSEPLRELESLFNHLNLPGSKSVLEKIKKPSTMTKKNSPIIIGKDPLLHWRGDLSREQIYRGLKIMQSFGLDKIYSDEAFPDLNGIEKLRLINNQAK